jgi:hypothetical protein
MSTVNLCIWNSWTSKHWADVIIPGAKNIVAIDMVQQDRFDERRRGRTEERSEGGAGASRKRYEKEG